MRCLIEKILHAMRPWIYYTGQGRRGTSGATQGHAWWYFFPNSDTPSEGEVTWWNDAQDIDRFASFVRSRRLGGVFTWIATSDAQDWRVHKRLNADLNNGSIASLRVWEVLLIHLCDVNFYSFQYLLGSGYMYSHNYLCLKDGNNEEKLNSSYV